MTPRLLSLSLLVLLGGAVGCKSHEEQELDLAIARANVKHHEALLEADAKAFQACIAAGKIPVRSEWTGRLKECK